MDRLWEEGFGAGLRFCDFQDHVPLPQDYRSGDPANVAEMRLRRLRLVSDTNQKIELTQQNCRPLLHELLWAEEAQQNVDIRAYDLFVKRPFPGVGTSSYSIFVPGLAEKRPSVLKGDFVWIDEVHRHDRTFMCKVAKVDEQSIIVKVTRSGFSNSPPFRMRFSVARTSLRHMHRAIDACALDVFSQQESFEMLHLRGTNRICPSSTCPTLHLIRPDTIVLLFAISL